MNLGGLVASAMGEMQNRRLQHLYQKDFIAWQADVLGIRTYKKMEGILETALFGEKPRTLIKSSNGTSKSYSTSAAILWVGSVFDHGESLAIVSAPSQSQIEKVTFRYIKSFKARAAERGFDLPGTVNEQLEWWVPGPEGKLVLAYGRKPAAGQEVSTFQGIRSEFGKTYVFFDEAGGMSRGMWTAAEAVLTGAEARLIAIGNPDDVGTEWHRYFREEKYAEEFNRFTISSFDLPTFTGEVVYPDDPEMEKRMLGSLTQVSWVEHKKRIWGETDARYLSKVKGEFPKDGGNGFFPQSAIDKAHDTEIEADADIRPILGVDIARWGQDESVIASNVGGRVRVVDTWAKSDLVDSARRIHQYATSVDAAEVRIDSTGVGGGVYDMLDRLPEFFPRNYTLIGWDNGGRAPDPSQHLNKRAYAHDELRTGMVEGKIDLDYDDEQLRDELQLITFKFTNRGSIQITPKDDLKTEIGGSPDRLDAVIMSVVDVSPWTGRLPEGTPIVQERSEIPDFGLSDYLALPGRPML